MMIDYLNKLNDLDLLREGVQAGVIPTSVYSHIQIYNVFKDERRRGHDKSEAVKITSIKMKCCERTVYRVIKKMTS